MSHIGMARHTDSAFNEKSAVRILSDFLEQKHTVATFFKENDRTPNYDGSFELVGRDDAPTKHFIVQIKKVENLTPNISGANKGKYVYHLDTSFLYYVKGKVIENPAIYFVVDIATNNIFWLYLSDELLMSLDFEGKERIAYPFKETDIVPDIDTFVQALNQIAAKRNALFLQKTPEQIAEMQDALDYINRLMENDFSKIKEAVFPSLWRFGIKYTPGESMSITVNGQTTTSESTAMFALYPQIKGMADTGLKEYSDIGANFFNHFDLAGRTTPMEYTRDSLHKIIKKYFENVIPAVELPNIMLFERMDKYVHQLQHFYEFKIDDGKILVRELYQAYKLLALYVQHIILDSEVDQNEEELKAEIITRLKRGEKNFFDIFRYGRKVVDCYKSFCEKQNDVENVKFARDLLFSVIPKYQIAFLLDLLELRKRKLEYFEPVWSYNFFELTKLNADEFMAEVDKICAKWFSKLPDVYNSLFDILFEKNNYRFNGKFEYCNEYVGGDSHGFWFSSTVREYGSDTFSIVHKPGCSRSFSEEDKNNGLLCINDGFQLEDFLKRKTLFYDAARCLLYQGICKELGYKASGLRFDGMNYSLF